MLKRLFAIYITSIGLVTSIAYVDSRQGEDVVVPVPKIEKLRQEEVPEAIPPLIEKMPDSSGTNTKVKLPSVPAKPVEKPKVQPADSAKKVPEPASIDEELVPVPEAVKPKPSEDEDRGGVEELDKDDVIEPKKEKDKKPEKGNDEDDNDSEEVDRGITNRIALP